MSLRCSGVRVLTVACVPTGAKTGVTRSPCGVVKMPVRAQSFLDVMVNWNIGGIIRYSELDIGNPLRMPLEVDSVSMVLSTWLQLILFIDTIGFEGWIADLSKWCFSDP